MPDFFPPELDSFLFDAVKADTSHPACKVFKVDSFKSIWIASKDFPLSSSDWTCWTYHFKTRFYVFFDFVIPGQV